MAIRGGLSFWTTENPPQGLTESAQRFIWACVVVLLV
jgi:hypothetical protein